MSDTNPTGTLLRFARWGILIAALVIDGALLANAWSGYASVADRSRTLIIGQRSALLAGVNRQLKTIPGPPAPADVADLLAEFQPQGLRFLAVPTPSGVAQAGRSADLSADLSPGPAADIQGLFRRPEKSGGEPIQTIAVGTRVRAIHWPPSGHPPPPGHRPPPGGPPPPRGHEFGPPPGPDFGPPPRPAPPLLIEFEPLLARALLADARRTLLINGAIALALLVGALLAFRWLRRQEAMEARRVRERHLATLGEMSAVLAHEIRNPLASLKGHAQLLAEVLPAGKQHDKAERVVREAVRLERLTTGLLQFVRTGDIARRSCDPTAIARAAIEEVRAGQLDSGAIALHLERAPSTWSLDPDRMHQVLTNLIRNGVQAAREHENGDARSDAPLVTVRVASDRDALLYEILDAGPGIAAGAEQAIFEPFHTGRVRGTGLGLAVAKRVVDYHGGTITADNHPDGGGLFRIVIPTS